jgi:beta-glucanase (GH16 family)
MAAPFVSVDIEGNAGNTDNSIGSFPYNKRIVEVKKSNMKYKIIIGVVVFCLLAGGATAAGILISKNNDGSSTPSPPPSPVEPDNPPDGPYLYEDPPFLPKDGFEAMWWDEFDGDEIDRSKWYVQPDVSDYYTVRRELQHYIDDPSTMDVYNGTLNIIASNPEGVQFDEKNPNYDQTYYTSARINTNSTGGNWNPGMFVDNSTWSTIRVEARLKAARGPGVVSSFWMLPVVNECHAEIDIFETPRCNTAHSGSWVTRGDSYHKNGFDKEETYDRFCDEYVVYAVEWSAESISFYVDDELIGTTDVGAWYGKCPEANDPLAPYANRPFYMILNVPIGTRWAGIPQNDIFPAIMSVDYVRVSGIRDT